MSASCLLYEALNLKHARPLARRKHIQHARRSDALWSSWPPSWARLYRIGILVRVAKLLSRRSPQHWFYSLLTIASLTRRSVLLLCLWRYFASKFSCSREISCSPLYIFWSLDVLGRRRSICLQKFTLATIPSGSLIWNFWCTARLRDRRGAAFAFRLLVTEEIWYQLLAHYHFSGTTCSLTTQYVCPTAWVGSQYKCWKCTNLKANFDGPLLPTVGSIVWHLKRAGSSTREHRAAHFEQSLIRLMGRDANDVCHGSRCVLDWKNVEFLKFLVVAPGGVC